MSRYLFRAEDLRKAEGLARVGVSAIAHGLLSVATEEEPQRGGPLNHGIRGQLSFTEQIRLILPQLVRAESIRRTLEITDCSGTCSQEPQRARAWL
jgi:hypothetical protein